LEWRKMRGSQAEAWRKLGIIIVERCEQDFLEPAMCVFH
jgi:hypothetical protein